MLSKITRSFWVSSSVKRKNAAVHRRRVDADEAQRSKKSLKNYALPKSAGFQPSAEMTGYTTIGDLRARARISSQSWRSDLVQIWPIRLSKIAGIASYFEEFANEASVKDGLKLRCQNVKLFLREP